MVSFDDIARAHERIKPQAKRTPVMTSATVDALTGASVFFKCENFQRMGAFKFRGAYNALSQLGDDAKKRGVVAFSSGNHAQAIALSGKLLGIKTVIVMPHDAPKVKLDATRGYGAEVVQYIKHEDRETLATKLAAERGLTLIPPFDHPHIIAGQGTAAKELIEDTGPLDVLLVPCGGGGLLSGSSIAAKHLAPECRVIGVEPAAGDDATQSFAKKRLVTIAVPDTIADGARTPVARQAHLPDRDALRRRHADRDRRRAHARDVLPVGADEDPGRADRGACRFCRLLEKKIELQRETKVGVILSGGNVDLRWAAAQMNKA